MATELPPGSRLRIAARWVIAAVLGGAALIFLNGALGNTWAAGGPPTPHPEIYWSRAVQLYWATILCAAASVAAFVLPPPPLVPKTRGPMSNSSCRRPSTSRSGTDHSPNSVSSTASLPTVCVHVRGDRVVWPRTIWSNLQKNGPTVCRVPPNPSLQRTSPGHSPGCRR